MSIARLQPFESTVDTTVKKGEKVTSWRLIKYADFVGEIVASDNIKADDKLSVSYDTAE